MTEDPDVSIAAVIDKLRITLREPVNFTQTDTETTIAKVRVLTAAATYLNILAVSEFGGRVGPVREQGLVEHVIGAAFQTYAGEDPHPGPFDKAAMLLRGITQGHPFNDGNKRTGFLVVTYYLDRMGYRLPRALSEREVVALCLRISAGDIRDLDVIAAERARLWDRLG